MSPPPNVAILLTPPGAAAIAVIRLSGDKVEQFIANHFSRFAVDGRCVHGTLRDEAGSVIDDPVVVRSASGNVADLNMHGGAWVVRSVLALAEREGFEIRESAALPAIAFDADSELEREVLEHLPRARTERGVRELLAQPRAWADFKPRATPEELQAVLFDRSLEHLLNPPRVAIVGAPNVGKSTLANQLFAQERSITADVPGTTRDWVGEIANVNGLPIVLVDTPGVRETADPIERIAIDRSRDQVRRADLVVLVLDATRPLAPEQEPLLRSYPDAMKVINKIDRPIVLEWDAPDAIRTIASTGLGVDRLREEIQRHFGCLDAPVLRPRAWTERQRSVLERALTHLEQVRDI